MPSPNPENYIDFAADDAYADLGLEAWMPVLAQRVLEAEKIHANTLSVLITDDDVVRALNREYRGYDEPTDVLSFGLSELAKPATDDEESMSGFVLPPDTPRQLGEIVLAYPTAERQAAEHFRALQTELAHLLIHGVLHLLGYDHYEPEEAAVMRARENDLLAKVPWMDGNDR